MWPLAIAGVLGSLLQANTASDAASAANKTTQSAQAKKDAYQKLLMAMADKLDASGAFDPSAQMQEARIQSQKGEEKDTNNAASAYRTMGYNPGDTPPVEGINAIRGRYFADLANQGYSAKQNAGLQKLNMYRMVSPDYSQEIGMSNQNAQAAKQQAANLYGQIPGQVMSIMPYLAQNNQSGVMNQSANALGGGATYRPSQYYRPGQISGSVSAFSG